MLFKKEKKFEDLTEQDVIYEVRQKGIDMKNRGGYRINGLKTVCR